MKMLEKSGNATISYGQVPQEYHRAIGRLAKKYVSQNPSVLEVGCGVGNTITEITDNISIGRLAILDTDENCVTICKDRFKIDQDHVVSPGYDLAKVFKDNKFDLIVHSHVLHYDEAPVETIRKMISLLSEDGIILLAVPNTFTFPVLFRLLCGKGFKTAGIFLWNRTTLSNLLGAVSSASCVEWHLDYVPFPIVSRFKAVQGFGKILTSYFPTFAFSHIVVIKKAVAT